MEYHCKIKYMGRFSDWSEKTKTLLTEKSRILFFGKNKGPAINAEVATSSLSAKLDGIRRPVLFLFGFALAAMLIEVTFQYVIPSKNKKAMKVESNTQPQTYLLSRSSYEPIIQKNIFCPGCEVPNLENRKTERPKDCNRADRLSGSIRLIGTIVLSNPEYSVATLSTGGAAKSFRTGERIDSYGSLFEIRRDRICILKSDDKLAYVDLPGVPKVESSYGAGRTARATTEGVSQVSDTEFEVKRDYLLKSLTDMSVLQTAYATPYFVDNEIQGFRIQSIEPGSPLLGLGLRPNDVITKADNQPITSMAKAQELVAGAASLDSLVITVLRGGSEVNLSFKVAK